MKGGEEVAMEVATERYTHFVYASGGSDGAKLVFGEDESATIDYRSAWMGSGKRQFRMTFRVKRFSGQYGLLYLTEVERLDLPLKLSDVEINEAVCGFCEDDERMLYWGVAYEYLRLPAGEAHIPNDPHLMDFKPLFNSTGWNERMDLILFGRILESAFAESGIDQAIADALCALDRLKFERTTDASPDASW
jgi:hypothetical protein